MVRTKCGLLRKAIRRAHFQTQIPATGNDFANQAKAQNSASDGNESATGHDNLLRESLKTRVEKRKKSKLAWLTILSNVRSRPVIVRSPGNAGKRKWARTA
jgi:hypothetical protein